MKLKEFLNYIIYNRCEEFSVNKMIVAGGRDFKGTFADFKKVRKAVRKYNIKIIVSGEADGADKFGEYCADILGLKVKYFSAAWDDLTADPCVVKTRWDGSKYNVLAGFNRNKEMAGYVEYAFLFPGGSGTADMRKQAKEAGIKIVFDNGEFL